jgi:hypothetical protein
MADLSGLENSGRSASYHTKGHNSMNNKQIIEQLVATLENHDGNYKLSKEGSARVNAALTAARAHLEQPAPSTAGKREPLTLEKIADLNCVSIDRLDYDVFELDQESVIDFARAVEAAHGITHGGKV